MAAPPEHIRIKRRREEEPVETLYIQSNLHQSKRRFTDYVFQRVVRSEGASPAATPRSDGGGPSIKSPRAVSSGASTPAFFGSNRGVPVIRTTAPGDEFKDSRAKLGASKDGVTAEKDATRAGGGAKSAVPKASPSFPLRRFHITAPATEAEGHDSAKFLHKGSGGVQKRKGVKQMARAVVVEKLAHATSGPKVVSALDELASRIGDVSVSSDVKEAVAAKQDTIASTGGVEQVVSPPRKRHVVNEAEKRWKSENQANRHGDRTYRLASETVNQKKVSQSMYDDPSSWDQNSEQLASELEQFALQMTGDVAPSRSAVEVSPERKQPQPTPTSPVKQKLKYQPHTPKGGRPRAVPQVKSPATQFDGSRESDEEIPMDVESSQPTRAGHDSEAAKQPDDVTMEENADDNDDSFVYDEFIRRPVHELRDDPRTAHLLEGRLTGDEAAAPRDVGVVVISEEDVHYWDALAESDDEGKGWDSEDEDSNAEDNPANEYPEEDLEFDDEYDDTNAVYRQYRHNASDDEEFDVNDYDEYAYGTHCTYGDDSEGDDYDR